METLQTLGVALGLASLAGINLYLTVFVTGLAIRMDWVALAPQFHGLEVLGDPVIIAVAGFLYLVEFFADKIPWIDTAWDSVHSFIRPVGAAALAVAAIGDLHPVFEIVAALLAGGMALTSHVAKAGTRLVANGSPEPVSNIGLSLAEDGIVLGGLALINWNAIVALFVALAVSAIVLAFLPQLLRGIRANVWLAWRKLNAPSDDDRETEPGNHLPGSLEKTLRRSHSGDAPLLWSVPCLSGGGPGLTPNIRGWLVSLKGEPGFLFFVGKRLNGSFLLEIPLNDTCVDHRRGFLSDKIEIRDERRGRRFFFIFERGLTAVAAKIASLLDGRRALQTTPAT
jgi:hypothetical protein